MKKSFVVIGLGRFGLTLLEELSNYGNEIIGIDNDLDAVNKASNIIEQVYQADSTSEIALKNIKRNKKKYRVTIISLFISIVLFISFST